MSKPNAEKTAETKGPSAPTPPYYYNDNASSVRAPPPSYEESQRAPPQYTQGSLGYSQGPVTGTHYYGMTYHQQLPQQRVLMQPYNAPSMPQIPQGLVGPCTSTGAAAAHVLTLDSRAEVRTTAAGNVIIPPPPPGCLPTPAQLAAMQGQPVVLKQKKRSFF